MDEHKLENDPRFMDQYSRQIGTFGMETMSKLIKMNVLIVGLQGVGIEVAKNLVLAGPGAVTLYDDGATERKDLGTNFFLADEDIGKPRASCVSHKLSELNKMVSINVHTGPLTESVVGQHSVVLFTNTYRQELIRWNEFCRKQTPAIGFILADIRGAMGYVFTDFGPQFTTHDASGENPITRIITNISNEKEAIVSILGPDEGGKTHELPDSDHDGWIEIRDVEGMGNSLSPDESVCSRGPYRIQFCTKKAKRKRNGKEEEVDVFDPYRLKIGDTSHLTPYNRGGVFTQHKKPYVSHFRSLQDSLKHPVNHGDFGLIFTDGAKFGRAEQLHMAIHGLMEFEDRNGYLPKVGDKDHASQVIELARSAPNSLDSDGEVFKVEELDEDVVLKAALYAAAELQPMAAFFGGVVAQEIIKFTGKFTPLRQWMHFDAFEVLPDEVLPEEETRPRNSRYDHIISIYGEKFQKRLGDVRTFLVGCGALGCEYLKNFALIGLGCGGGGLVTVTDNDRIEVSNLNRQFLFRDHNVGESKSVAASNAARAMNAELRVEALEHLVSPSTEHIFHDNFWESMTVVTNALDNVKARLYVDSKCVFYSKPLLESGTLGTKCNVQVILPHKTQSYADGPKDAKDDSIPMCTLRNFPSLIEHTIEWARAMFEDQFTVPPANAAKFVKDPAAYIQRVRLATLDHPNPKIGSGAISSELESLRSLVASLKMARDVTFAKCVERAFTLFYTNFRDRILQLIHTFPQDHRTSAGEKFWSGAKRFPQVAHFEITNGLHMGFIINAANILAASYGLHLPPDDFLVPLDSPLRSDDYVGKIIEEIDVPVWTPSNEKIAADDEELKRQEEELRKGADESERLKLEALLVELGNISVKGLKFEPAEFEKDQDLNFHIDFIYTAANLRAWNYSIREASKHKCKMIAGKIIPAIATTTASVTGLAMLEMLKLLQDKELSAFKDSSNSLALNMYLMQEPAVAEREKDDYDVIEMSDVKCRPTGFTKWEKTYINGGNLTMGQFLEAFKEKTGLNCDLLFHACAEMGSVGEKYQAVSGLMLYDRNSFSADLTTLYEQKKDTLLLDWIYERYGDVVPVANGSSIQLQTSCSDDDGCPFKVPTVVCRFR